MREIPLTTGGVTQVSDEDYEYLSQFKWRYYSNRHVLTGRKNVTIRYLVAQRMGLNPEDKTLNNKDHNPLNNQRDNLRIATPSQGNANRGLFKSNTSGYKGVSRSRKSWRADIGVNDKRIYLGSFDTAERAHAAYCEAAEHYFGEFARAS